MPTTPPSPAQSTPTPVPAVPNPCPRFAAWSAISEPPALHSANGGLSVSFSFQTRTDAQGRTLYCFMTRDGLQNPTLHVVPGDTLSITVTNNTPQGLNPMTINPPNCGASTMYTSSVNIHYHGTNVTPTCGADEVLKTIINSGETFRYDFTIPPDEPPGMYWYHPHVHGMADPMAMGGATGALIVNGMEHLQPAVADLPQRTFLIRDQVAAASPHEGPDNCGGVYPFIGVPFRDISVNYVPNDSYFQGNQLVENRDRIVSYARGYITAEPRQREFWRVANIAADTILDLQLIYDGVPQTLHLVAIDGVPVNSQDGTVPGRLVPVRHFRLPPASRIEFIVTTPSADAISAQLVTNNINTGHEGNCDPRRPVFAIATAAEADVALHREPPPPSGSGRRFAGLASAPVTARRTVIFAENEEAFFMTVEGQPNRAFDPNMPPAIVTTVGSVEQWTVQNRTRETHVFHIHQIHFLVQSQDNFGSLPLAPGIVGQYLDTIEVPAWDGVGPYPSASLLLDFRGSIAGRFVFHCHILRHEDKGMMNVIQVNPRDAPSPSVPAPASRPAHGHSHQASNTPG
jgi:FtsP/CotA-like multicopper oxidase with cupredoxin domain